MQHKVLYRMKKATTKEKIITHILTPPCLCIFTHIFHVVLFFALLTLIWFLRRPPGDIDENNNNAWPHITITCPRDNERVATRW